MKEREEEIMKEVEKTTVFFDRLQQLEPNPFLFTRIEARLDSQPALRKAFRSAWVVKSDFHSRILVGQNGNPCNPRILPAGDRV